MPHIHLQTTGNLSENTQIEDILARLVAKLCEFETIDPRSVKAYHSLRTQWAMGEGAAAGFVHCQVSVLAGRPQELRTRIARAMFDTLKDECADSLISGEAGITVEVREMEPVTYLK